MTRGRAIIAALATALVALVGPPSHAADEVGFEFHRTPFSVLTPSERTLWPYVGNATGPLQGSYTFDAEGVSVRVNNGTAYDHPVLQAQYMLTRLSMYSHNQNQAYLDSVIAHAERLLDNAVISRGAMYLPYPFDWAMHGDPSKTIEAPWFSAMAQGQALSAFVRLFEATGNQRYRDAADQIFASYLNLKADGIPWTSTIDDQGYLWFEEYAEDVGADRSINGHIYATFGLWDYYRLTGSTQAEQLFQGGVTAVLGHMADFRNPGWISHYSLAHPQYQYASYHEVHVNQLYQLYNLTGATALATAADRLLDDYPSSQLGGRGYLAAGAHAGLRVSSAGEVTSSRNFALSAAQAVTLGKRARIVNRPGIWLEVTSGTMQGYWVRETPDRAFVKLSIERYNFAPVRLLHFKQGTYTGFRFNNLGLRASSKTFTLTRDSAAHINAALHNPGCSRGLKPPDSRSDRAM